MNSKQRFQKLKELCPCSVNLDSYDNWYVDIDAEFTNGTIVSSMTPHTKTVNEAIKGAFEILTNPPEGHVVITGGYSQTKYWEYDKTRQHWRQIVCPFKDVD